MTKGEVLYIAGPDSMINVLRNVAAALWSEDIHIFYKGYPSCLGVANLVNSEPTTPDPAEIGTLDAHLASFWPGDPNMESTCDLPFDAMDPDEPEIVPDIILSDVFATTCADYPNGLGSLQDFQGPVLGFGFILHPSSSPVSISAEAASLVFGSGAGSHVVAPWTDPATILHRDPNSGAENVFAKAIRFRCRLEVPDSPPGIPLSSQVRHNLTMVVKEAIHNVIKHARATEVRLRIAFEASVLSIGIQDDGCGFDPAARPSGSGLGNLKLRLEGIGGSFTIESRLGAGTTVSLRLEVAAAGSA